MKKIILTMITCVSVFAATQVQAGSPAARVNDITSHGGHVVQGNTTVLIGGLPAARKGDFANCPLIGPAPLFIPHQGGVISTGSNTVLIGGMPAAREADLIPEVGSTSVISVGNPTVLIGN